MKQLLLFKFGARAKSTSWGIALCTMFIVSSFSIAGGLESSMERLTATFESEYFLITKSGTNGMNFFDESEVAQVGDDLAMGIATNAFILPYEESVTVFSVTDAHGVLPVALGPTNDTVLKSRLGYSLGEITLVGEAPLNLALSGTYSSTLFPSDWLLASLNITWRLTDQVGRFNYAIGKSLDDTDSALLEERGFSIQSMVGIIDFLRSGVDDIRADMSWVLLPSAFVIAVLAYSFIGSEIADRRHEIGILKTIGAGRSRILSYLLGDALLISAWGGLLGVALGTVLSYAISTSASMMFTSVFVMRADELLLVISFLATVGAGVLGAMLPAVRMMMSPPVEDLKETAP